jgi:Tfp pilus assembly protein PilX
MFRSASQFRSVRRGAVLIAVVVVLAISLALFGVWARAALQQHRRMRNEQSRLQAVRLAEAGVRRGIAQRALDAAYSQEVWQVPASELDTTHAGKIAIRVNSGEESRSLRFEATAEFPVGAINRAQVTKRIEMTTSVTGNEP